MFFRIQVVFPLVFFATILIAKDEACSEHESSNSKTANCSGLALQNLPNISKDVNILDLSKNEISYLSFTNATSFPALKEIILSHNKITKIEIFYLPSLKLVDLSNNKLHDIDDVNIQSKSQIEMINLNGNNIISLKNSIFERNRNLQYLSLSENPISAVSFLSSESIRELHLNNIHLHYVRRDHLIRLVNLKKLSVANNKRFYTLNRNGFVILENLRMLNVSHCGLYKLDVNGFPKLEKLDSSYNSVKSITDDTFKFNVNISSIDLSFNSIDFIESSSFVKNKKLEVLNLQGNKIIDLRWTANLRNVLNLNMSHNGVIGLLNLNLASVKVLDFSNNRIKEIMADLNAVLPKVVYLNLESNLIKEIKELRSSTVTFLSFASCKIVNIEENAFVQVTRLIELNLSDNKIKNINFAKNLMHLQELNLKENAWECNCKDKDQIRLFLAENVTIVDDVLCVPDGLTWMGFCRKADTEKRKELENLKSLVVVTKSGVDAGWIAGGLSISILVTAVSIWLLYRKRRRNRILKKFRRKDQKPALDLLQSTPPTPQTYHYSYVLPPSEEVEFRRTYRDSVRPKVIDLQELEEIQSVSSLSCNEQKFNSHLPID